MNIQQQVGYQISEFSFQLYQKLSFEQNNLVFSPASIYLAITMVAIGSNDSTLEQLKNVLNFNTPQQLAQDIQNLQFILTQQGNGVTTRIANNIYADLPKLGQEYEYLMTNYFKAAVQKVNFACNSEQIRQEINHWVSEQTNQKINNLLGSGSINSLTKLVLVNAIYFKGEWQSKFETKSTSKRYFYLEQDESGQQIKVDTMHRKDKYDFYENEKFMYVSIPYKEDEYVMEIILPKESLENFERIFNHQTFLQSREQKKNTLIKLYLPKFKIDPSNSTSLTNILKQLGIDKIFSSDANFSFMDPTNSIKVSDVIHKAMIEVNEEGAEAAAATAVIMTKRSKPQKIIIPEMDCNKPFIYSITHKQTNTIMFFGKITNPSQNY